MTEEGPRFAFMTAKVIVQSVTGGVSDGTAEAQELEQAIDRVPALFQIGPTYVEPDRDEPGVVRLRVYLRAGSG